MNKPRKIPYGISDFESIIVSNLTYVDKTKYIEILEQMSERFLFFLRPRRFGKSLLISSLFYYYGKQHKAKFKKLFGKLYIGKNPTPNKNAYHILRFDFSAITTLNEETTFFSFNNQVNAGITSFYSAYQFCSQDELDKLLAVVQPGDRMVRFFEIFKNNFPGEKIYILIDEYDHFANEIIAFNFNHFSEIVSRNGYVRKFYEAIKMAAGSGGVERMFVTGVTPVTLDSLTSGFNIGKDISLVPECNEMMGFTEQELRYVISEGCEAGKFDLDTLVIKMEKLYNGSLFSSKGKFRLYNSDMVLYFLTEFVRYEYEFPAALLDKNVSSDYSKISKMISFKNPAQNKKILQQIIEKEVIDSGITEQFNFEREFTTQDFISLLYYNGLLTIKELFEGRYRLQIPNYVIKELYWSFFLRLILPKENLLSDDKMIGDALVELAYRNDIRPCLELIEKVLETVSNRDKIKFDEKYIKFIFISYAVIPNLYHIRSEPEYNQKYPDLLFLFKESEETKHQFLFEFKYLPKSTKKNLETVKQKAIEQVKGYQQLPEIKQLKNLQSWVVIFVGNKAKAAVTVSNEQLAVSN